MLANCEGVCAGELRTLSELVQAAFTRLLVLLSVHAKIVLWEASSRVVVVEGAVAAVKDVHLRVVQFRVAMCVLLAVLRAYELSPISC